MKVAGKEIEIVKPRPWDLAAAAAALLGVAAAAANLQIALRQEPGVSISGLVTWAFVALQFGVCLGSLLILGKTAKEGTIWGNLAAVAGMFVGMGGVLLAAALWTAA